MCLLKRQKYAVARIFSAGGLAAMGRLRKGVFLIKIHLLRLDFAMYFLLSLSAPILSNHAPPTLRAMNHFATYGFRLSAIFD